MASLLKTSFKFAVGGALVLAVSHMLSIPSKIFDTIMTAKQNLPKQEGNAEFLLNTLTDDTPPSSDEEEETPANVDGNCEESICKYEKEALNRIMAIRKEVAGLEEDINQMEKAQLQEEFRKYEEALIQKTILLDKVDTKDIEVVKDERKRTIVYVQDVLSLLDHRVK